MRKAFAWLALAAMVCWMAACSGMQVFGLKASDLATHKRVKSNSDFRDSLVAVIYGRIQAPERHNLYLRDEGANKAEVSPGKLFGKDSTGYFAIELGKGSYVLQVRIMQKQPGRSYAYNEHGYIYSNPMYEMVATGSDSTMKVSVEPGKIYYVGSIEVNVDGMSTFDKKAEADAWMKRRYRKFQADQAVTNLFD